MKKNLDTILSLRDFRLEFLVQIGPKDCIKLTVPVIDESRARLRLRMQFENSPNYTVDDIKEVSVTPFEPIHLIQTDKAWYTPGQLVRFRILSLNYILHPLLDPVGYCFFFFTFLSLLLQNSLTILD